MIFERENRYLVFKWKDLANLPNDIQNKVYDYLYIIDTLVNKQLPERAYVVVEEDWPEYEKVWKMIEDRVTKGGRGVDSV